MMTRMTGTVVNGALHLDQSLELPEQSRVTVFVTPAPEAVRRKEILKKFFESSDETPLFAERLTREQLHERG